MSDQEEKAAQALADWIDSGGQGPPPENVDPDVIGAAFVLNRELVPEFNPSFDDVRSRVMAQRPPQAANNNRWFGGLAGAIAGAAAVLLFVSVGQPEESAEIAELQQAIESLERADPFETVADKVGPEKELAGTELRGKGLQPLTSEQKLGGLELNAQFEPAGWHVDGTTAQRAIVYAGQPAIQKVVVAEDKVQSISIASNFVTPSAATDPMAAGQTITSDPEEAARDFRNVLDAQFSLHGFAPTPTAETADGATKILFCTGGQGRLLNTLATSEARVQIVVSEPAEGCVE